MFETMRRALLAVFTRPEVIHQPLRRAYPVKYDADGRSARARAFGFFDQGLRPSALPDVGVSRGTLYRYYQSWKHAGRDALAREQAQIVRALPETAALVAEDLGLPSDVVAKAYGQRNPRGALQRAIELELRRLADQAVLTRDERERGHKLLRHYGGKDSAVLALKLSSLPTME